MDQEKPTDFAFHRGSLSQKQQMTRNVQFFFLLAASFSRSQMKQVQTWRVRCEIVPKRGQVKRSAKRRRTFRRVINDSKNG